MNHTNGTIHPIMKEEKHCLQLEVGPTPCFRETGQKVCSLDYCPAQKYVDDNKGEKWDALHFHCVMSENYQGEDGRGEFIAAIASRRKR